MVKSMTVVVDYSENEIKQSSVEGQCGTKIAGEPQQLLVTEALLQELQKMRLGNMVKVSN